MHRVRPLPMKFPPCIKRPVVFEESASVWSLLLSELINDFIFLPIRMREECFLLFLVWICLWTPVSLENLFAFGCGLPFVPHFHLSRLNCNLLEQLLTVYKTLTYWVSEYFSSTWLRLVSLWFLAWNQSYLFCLFRRHSRLKYSLCGLSPWAPHCQPELRGILCQPAPCSHMASVLPTESWWRCFQRFSKLIPRMPNHAWHHEDF